MGLNGSWAGMGPLHGWALEMDGPSIGMGAQHEGVLDMDELPCTLEKDGHWARDGPSVWMAPIAVRDRAAV